MNSAVPPKGSLPTEKEVEEAACAAANRRIEESANDDPAYPHEFRCHVRGFFDGAEWERSRGIKQALQPTSVTDEMVKRAWVASEKATKEYFTHSHSCPYQVWMRAALEAALNGE